MSFCTGCLLIALLDQRRRFEALDISFYLRDVFESTNYDIKKEKKSKKQDLSLVETTAGSIVSNIEPF